MQNVLAVLCVLPLQADVAISRLPELPHNPTTSTFATTVQMPKTKARAPSLRTVSLVHEDLDLAVRRRWNGGTAPVHRHPQCVGRRHVYHVGSGPSA